MLNETKNVDLNRKFIIFDEWYARLRTSKLSGKNSGISDKIEIKYLVNPDKTKNMLV